ncbi:RdgB/HAM1 family non-canonical purine NTP pyrophosphatase [Anaerococcus sp. mt242]|uniref:RdgB/HAM1 family non-canonical purine NTP pyrophosphatase n=1 Tax=unclassified Anaerococcus TaxID=2614126 RepID=UPI0019347F86|nr:RdgB/HAM1 family non-canonical purine NTP pyrophosphatase [Anaerococcus sp. mt242]MBM0045722.1 RdgB/HAM1 family non-canonical purine NTP pyrophosphatase [Anaerococcus sp. mt242]
MEIVFASGNKDKINQVKLILNNVDLKTPIDFEIENYEVEEDGMTLKENAYKKAKALFDLVNKPTIADDTGLYVNALDGRPGVHSHRYAGENPTYKENRNKLLNELKGKDDRSAYFETCLCFIDQNGSDHYFYGKLPGTITSYETGDYDFGYDQIFMPENFDITLGEMTKEKINMISHRSKAFSEFKKYLRKK